jgi:hypothetical protein
MTGETIELWMPVEDPFFSGDRACPQLDCVAGMTGRYLMGGNKLIEVV